MTLSNHMSTTHQHDPRRASSGHIREGMDKTGTLPWAGVNVPPVGSGTFITFAISLLPAELRSPPIFPMPGDSIGPNLGREPQCLHNLFEHLSWR